MKTKAFLLVVIAALIMSACEQKSEDKVTEVFKEYVKTDFGNPSDFIEITKFDKKDTISNEWVMDYLVKLDSLDWALNENQKKQLAWLKHKNSENNTFIVQHKIKVRVKSGKESQEVVDYYVIEKNGEYSVQDHELQEDEMPDEIVDAILLLNDVTKVLKIINGSY